MKKALATTLVAANDLKSVGSTKHPTHYLAPGSALSEKYDENDTIAIVPDKDGLAGYYSDDPHGHLRQNAHYIDIDGNVVPQCNTPECEEGQEDAIVTDPRGGQGSLRTMYNNDEGADLVKEVQEDNEVLPGFRREESDAVKEARNKERRTTRRQWTAKKKAYKARVENEKPRAWEMAGEKKKPSRFSGGKISLIRRKKTSKKYKKKTRRKYKKQTRRKYKKKNKKKKNKKKV